MTDKLDFLVRFWELLSRNAALGEPLGASERIELLALLQLLMGELGVPAAGVYARPRDALSAQLIGDGKILPVEVRSVAAGALIVSGVGGAPSGSQVIVQVGEPVMGVEYVLPCVVLWEHPGSPTTWALRVDGIPRRRPLVSRWERRPSPRRSLGPAAASVR